MEEEKTGKAAIKSKKPRAAAARKKIETVLVTGGAGCVGSFVVQELLKLGFKVRAADRPGATFPEVDKKLAPRFETREGDIRDRGFLEACVKGVDRIIHTAANLDLSLSLEEIRPINTDPVIALYEAAVRGKVKSMVHFSSCACYKFAPCAITEDMPVEATNNYEQSKILADEYLAEGIKKNKLPVVTIVRPGLIFGPKGRALAHNYALLPPIVGMISRRMLGLKGGPKSNYVHALDMARAAVFLQQKNQKSGEIFNVAIDDAKAVSDVFNIACETYGLKLSHPFLPFPEKLIKRYFSVISRPEVMKNVTRMLGYWWEALVKKYGLEPELFPKIDAEFLVFGINEAVYSNQKLKDKGFVFTFPDFESAWRNTIEWYQENRWMPELSEQKLLGKVGFKFLETMSGSINLEKEGERQVQFTVSAEALDIQEFFQDNTCRLRGTISMNGIATDSPVEGTLEIAFWPPKRRLVYDLHWTGDDGRRYRICGIKRVRYLDFITTMTTLHSSLYRGGELIGKGKICFPRADLPKFILSFRPVI
ncbi:MAG: NAD(P)-dependent oxidoreductase [bacterium]|nr:NAD(P)-dependent oxidoreductase [bacterium]